MPDHSETIDAGRTGWIAVLALFGCASCSSPAPKPDPSAPSGSPKPLEVHVAAWNDFHGSLEGPTGTAPAQEGVVQAGGAAQLAGWLDAFRAEHEHTATVVAGDLIGASPLLSTMFHDQPTIEVMNEIGLDAAAVGNHEFDRGWRELLRLAEGGCHPEEGCRNGSTYGGADFPFLAANVYRSDGERLLDPYVVREFDGERVAFVGLVLDGVPSIVTPTAVDDLTFEEEVEALEKVVPELRDRGVEAIVAVVHEGGTPDGEPTDGIDNCWDIEGPIARIAEHAPEAVDAFVSGHTHHPYVCRIAGRPVTATMSKGRVVTELELTIDRRTGDVSRASADNHVIRHDGPSSDRVAGMIERYAKLADRRADKSVGRLTETLSRTPRESGQSVLGCVVADAHLFAAKPDGEGGPDFAMTNPGGIRDSLQLDPSDGRSGVVTYADLHRIQPFRNQLRVLTLTGRQIHDILENQWRVGEHSKILQVSEGFRYDWHPGREIGDRVDPEDVRVRGEPLELDAEYRVAVNNFLAEGGDGFSTFRQAETSSYGPLDIKAMESYFQDRSPVSGPDEDRIRRVPDDGS